MSLSKKSLILKSSVPIEVVLIGSQNDGARVLVDINLKNIEYRTEIFTRVFIEDDKGHKVTFYRSVNLTDIQAIGIAINEYRRF